MAKSAKIDYSYMDAYTMPKASIMHEMPDGTTLDTTPNWLALCLSIFGYPDPKKNIKRNDPNFFDVVSFDTPGMKLTRIYPDPDEAIQIIKGTSSETPIEEDEYILDKKELAERQLSLSLGA